MNKEKRTLQCVDLLPGQTMLILNTPQAFNALNDAIADAQTYTGRNFKKEILKNSFIVKN